ncbi:MAG: OpgC domain-containing protein [Chthoniobacteraceae bacterium]
MSVRPSNPHLFSALRLINPKWIYEEQGSRDLRLDWLRGYAVMAMVIDHIGDKSWLYKFTGGDEFFLSAAEAFVFISGMIVGVVYGRVLQKQGLGAASRKAFARAKTLYKLTVVMTILFIAVSVADELQWTEWIDLSHPVKFVFDIFTLRRTFMYVDIPLMYTVFMLLAPVGFFFLRGGRKWMMTGLGISWAVWLAFQFPEVQTGVKIAIQYNWTFKLPAWQLLFFNAMAIGYHRDYLAERVKSMRWQTRGIGLLIAISVFVFLTVFFESEGAVLKGMLTQEQQEYWMNVIFTKTWLGAGRLVAAAVLLPAAFAAITICWKPVYAFTKWITLLGANSLYAYTMHLMVILIFTAVIPFLPFYWEYEAMIDTGVQVATIFAIYWMIRTEFLFHTVAR